MQFDKRAWLDRIKKMFIGFDRPLALAVFLLMCGAVGYHIKAGDKVALVLPAVLTASLAVAVGVLATVAHAH